MPRRCRASRSTAVLTVVIALFLWTSVRWSMRISSEARPVIVKPRRPAAAAASVSESRVPSRSGSTVAAAAAAGRPRPVKALVACLGGVIHPFTEYDGQVVRSGAGAEGRATSASECCEACRAHRSCNVWVFANEDGACWLKNTPNPLAPSKRSAGPRVPWTSGALPRAFYDKSLPLPPADPSLEIVSIRTSEGDIRLRLKDDWHRPSADSVRRLTSKDLPLGACSQCEFYRVEYGFLVQG